MPPARRPCWLRQNFQGPRTVFEGTHGWLKRLRQHDQGQFREADRGFGKDWVAATLRVQALSCGTMTTPYIDCAFCGPNAVSSSADDIADMVCEVGRRNRAKSLWEPLPEHWRAERLIRAISSRPSASPRFSSPAIGGAPLHAKT